MDRIEKAVSRLWGPLEDGGRLHGSPSFAGELALRCNDKLPLRVSGVSKWSFGEQLEHLYLSSHYVLDRLEEAMTGRNSNEHRGFYGHGLIVAGFIPRYVFPTIPPLKPQSGTMEHIRPLRDSLLVRLSNLDLDLDRIRACPGKSRHPRMKYLSGSEWLFFADIHHRHHLAIMRDILKAAK
jgi:hypothetical protein